MGDLNSISRYRKLVGHLVTWPAYAMAIYAINLVNVNDMSLGRAVAITLLLALVFYPVLGVLYGFFRKGRFLLGAGALAGYLMVILPNVYYWAVYVLYPYAGIQLHVADAIYHAGEFYKNYGLGVFRFSVYAFVYYAVDKKIDAEKARSKMELEKMEAENQALRAENDSAQHEMAALSVQLSPHLLNSVLFKLHTLAIDATEHLPERILLLADVAAYATEATTLGGGVVRLGEEIDIIKSMQLLANVDVEFQGLLAGDANRALPGFHIPRMIFVTLFENAIKYSPTATNEPPISISLVATSTELVFTCRNKKGTAQRHGDSLGTGLANVRRRLQLCFGPQASLVTEGYPEAYEAVLRINFRT